MADCLPWVQQGDVFESVPVIRTAVSGGEVTVWTEQGAAVLITENCQLDKRTGSGKVREGLQLQFLPLDDVTRLNPDTWRRLRAGEVNPPEAVYVGAVGDTHLYGRLGAAFSLPAALFGCSIHDYTGHAEADAADPMHLTVADEFPRLMTMDPSLVANMHQKMWLFWTHTEPMQGELPV